MIRATTYCVGLVAAAALLAGCTATANPALEASGPPRVMDGWEPQLPEHAIEAGSTDFEAGGALPASIERDDLGCTGEDIRPELHWGNLPEGTESVVITVTQGATTDPADPTNRWILFNVPPGETAIAASGENPEFGVPGTNYIGRVTSLGPCSPAGEEWEIWFTVYALDIELGIDRNASLGKVQEAGTGHVLAVAELTGFYSAAEG